MNKVILMGRLTKDPEVRYTQGANQMAVARYTLAVDRRYRRDGEQEADFIPCVAFGKQAEHAERYYHKGLRVTVCGRIQTRTYTNRDGKNVHVTEVVIDEQEFAESKNAASNNSSSNTGGQANAGQSNYESPSDANDGFMNIPDGIDDELPFA